MPKIVLDSKEALFLGADHLKSLGYECEVGAKHINVTINNDWTNEQMEALEHKLSDMSACDVWVMQKNIIIDGVE